MIPRKLKQQATQQEIETINELMKADRYKRDSNGEILLNKSGTKKASTKGNPINKITKKYGFAYCSGCDTIQSTDDNNWQKKKNGGLQSYHIHCMQKSHRTQGDLRDQRGGENLYEVDGDAIHGNTGQTRTPSQLTITNDNKITKAKRTMKRKNKLFKKQLIKRILPFLYESGYVYFVQNSECLDYQGWIKIGQSADPEARVSNANVWSPSKSFKIVFKVKTKYKRELEAALLNKYAVPGAGEWTQESLAVIKQDLRDNGLIK